MGEVTSYTKTAIDALLAGGGGGGGTDFIADPDGPRIPIKDNDGNIKGYIGYSEYDNRFVIWAGADNQFSTDETAFASAYIEVYQGDIWINGPGNNPARFKLGEDFIHAYDRLFRGFRVQGSVVRLGNTNADGIDGEATPSTLSQLADILVALGVIASHTIGDSVTSSDVDAAIAALVASAPSTLNTLNELATALGNDPNFATTMATNIAAKATPADIATAVSAHEADTTNVHGIADTNGIMRVVVHGAVAGTARPAGGASIVVHWIGSVAPTNAIDNDVWTDNS